MGHNSFKNGQIAKSWRYALGHMIMIILWKFGQNLLRNVGGVSVSVWLFLLTLRLLFATIVAKPYANSVASHQSAHPHNLLWELHYSLINEQDRIMLFNKKVDNVALRLDCIDAQADLELNCLHDLAETFSMVRVKRNKYSCLVWGLIA